jgi:hypothetical protein
VIGFQMLQSYEAYVRSVIILARDFHVGSLNDICAYDGRIGLPSVLCAML